MGMKTLLTGAEKCKKYLNLFEGKKSILETAPIKRTNTRALGVCMPSGATVFQTEESALDYIFNSLKKAAKDGFEKVIIKKNATIVGEANGGQFEANEAFLNIKGVRERLEQNLSRDTEMFHSHPDIYGLNCTTPLSDPDIKTLFNFKLKKVVAINSKGEFNSLELPSKFNPLDFLNFQQNNTDIFLSEYFNGITKKTQELANKINSYKAKGEKVPEELYKMRDQLLEYTTRLEEQPNFTELDWAEKSRALHKAYSQAEHFGLKYTTNFSNLKYNA